MSPQTIRDIQEETINSLRNEITILTEKLENKIGELDEIKSILLLLLHISGNEIEIDQRNYSLMIPKILSGQMGLSVQESDDKNKIKLILVEVGEEDVV